MGEKFRKEFASIESLSLKLPSFGSSEISPWVLPLFEGASKFLLVYASIFDDPSLRYIKKLLREGINLFLSNAEEKRAFFILLKSDEEKKEPEIFKILFPPPYSIRSILDFERPYIMAFNVYRRFVRATLEYMVNKALEQYTRVKVKLVPLDPIVDPKKGVLISTVRDPSDRQAYPTLASAYDEGKLLMGG